MDIDHIKAQYKVSDIVRQRIAIKKNGKEFTACCPFHKEKTPSFTISDDKKIFHCFGCGENGDIFDFVMKMDGVGLKEAGNRITGTEPSGEQENIHDPYEDFEPIPFPDELSDLKPGAKIENIWNPKRGNTTYYIPNRVHRYTTQDGDIIGYVFRIDFKGGRKSTPQIMYCRKKSTKEQGLCHYPMPEPRYIYGLERLIANPKMPVIVVEGEKCVDEGQKAMTGFVVVSWCGGTNALETTDWKPLKGRNVVIFPDADEVGSVCSQKLLDILYPIVNTVKIVTHKDKPKGWDIADAIKEGSSKDDIIKYITGNVVVPEHQKDELPVPKDEQPVKDKGKKKKKEKPSGPVKSGLEQSEFKMLGYTRGKYYFLRYKTGVIKEFTGNQLMQIGNLCEIAPLEYWQVNYLRPMQSDRQGCMAAAAELISRSEDVGYFDKETVRGRGAWIDDGASVFHCGEYLIVNGKKTDVRSFQSQFIYQYKAKLNIFHEDPLSTAEANKIVPLLERMRWSTPINAKLLAGWIAASVVGACLPWRSHIYLFAPKGSGKSEVIKVAKMMMSCIQLSVQGSTTEAGIRQMLDSDTLPILFDESEGEDERKAKSMQDILFLARQSSSADGGYILKGSSGGEGQKFMIRSSFFMASIVPCIKHDADKSRFVQIRLARGDVKFEARDAANWKAFKNERDTLLTEEFCIRLVMRSITLIPQMIHNQKVFQDVAREIFGEARKADTYSMIFAGLYSLYSSENIAPDDASKWIRKQNWEEQMDRDVMSSEDRMIDKIMQSVVRVYPNNDMAISELITNIMRERGDDNKARAEDIRVLERCRMRVEGDTLWFATTSEFMDNTLTNTPWAVGWRDVLSTIDGAIKSKSSMRFSGRASRAIGIKIETALGFNVTKGEDDAR